MYIIIRGKYLKATPEYRSLVQNRQRQVPHIDYNYSFDTLPIKYWERSEQCLLAKEAHMDRIDRLCASREDLVLMTTLWNKNINLEPNMFPYDTPDNVLHYTLWSLKELIHKEIVRYVENWLRKRMPKVRRWNYDDNLGDRSFQLFHVHVYIETIPYSYIPKSDSNE